MVSGKKIQRKSDLSITVPGDVELSPHTVTRRVLKLSYYMADVCSRYNARLIG